MGHAVVDLFQSSKANISGHISNIIAESEVDPEATVRKFRTVRQEGVRQVTRTLTYYNLDLIISVGYRVKSRITTQFRIWATERLREYLVKGFTMDDAKLENLAAVPTSSSCRSAFVTSDPAKTCSTVRCSTCTPTAGASAGHSVGYK